MKFKLITVAIISIITLYQVLDTYSICKGEENIQMIYELKPGENIQTAATKFNTTTEKLQELNGVKSAYAGARLKID